MFFTMSDDSSPYLCYKLLFLHLLVKQGVIRVVKMTHTAESCILLASCILHPLVGLIIEWGP